MTTERVTIMMDSDIAKIIRGKQAKKIVEIDGNYSFSTAVNELLKEALK